MFEAWKIVKVLKKLTDNNAEDIPLRLIREVEVDVKKKIYIVEEAALRILSISISSGEIDFTYQRLLPWEITISPPYPNPFNPVMSIEYGIPEKSNVLIEIYNIQGRLVDKMVSAKLEAGYYTFTWDGSNHSSGIYLIQIKIADTIKNYRTLLIK